MVTIKKYSSKVDLWLIVLCFLTFAIPVSALLYDKLLPEAAIWFVVALGLIYSFSRTYYQIDGNLLRIKGGFFYYKTININLIRRVSETNDLISAPALSIDRLEIMYNKYDSVLVSPKRKREFIEHLKKVNNAIEVRLKSLS